MICLFCDARHPAVVVVSGYIVHAGQDDVEAVDMPVCSAARTECEEWVRTIPRIEHVQVESLREAS
jgi:hypothetical protein